MRRKIVSLIIVFVASTVSMFVTSSPGFAAAPESELEPNVQVAVDSSSLQRSVVPTEEGLKLNTVEGDSVILQGGHVDWRSGQGAVIASIELSSDESDASFRYDPVSQLIVAEKKSNSGISANACIPKWIAWAFNITWGTLVCIPAAAGAGGIATPLVGIVTGAACEAAGGAMVTAVSC